MIYGAKKQKGKQRKPNIQKDTTASTNYTQILYGLSEGEIFGLADGAKSIKLDGTPLLNDNGQPNFDNVWWDFRTGTVDQTHIQGFGSVLNELGANVELRHNRAYVKAFNNISLDAVIVRLGWGSLREQKDNGDIVGYRIEYAVDVQTDGGAYQEVLRTFIHDKASQGYQRSHRIELPKAKRGWTLRVRRLTPNRDSDLIGDSMSVVAVTEVIDAKLRYPHTALLALKYDSETFGNIAKMSVRIKGKLIQVPSNYNPDNRTYTGVWDGTFKVAYSNNPAWVFYDICTHKRYGLGERLAGKVDKWRLYQIAQYCDELVDDGKGGKEPRFTCNVYLQQADDAFKVLQSLASVFRGMTYWDGEQIVVDSDTPKDSVATFTRSNVVNGEFIYTGTRARDRHSVIKVAWDNPDNDYKTEYEIVRDDYVIARHGVSVLDVNAFGCTSQAQAQRVGQWALKSEQLETESVSFKTGLDGFVPKVGDVISIADDVRAGRAIGGRVVSASGPLITLDRAAGRVGDTIVLNAPSPTTAKITRVSGNVITIDKTLDVKAQSVWAMQSSDLYLQKFRVMSSRYDEASFDITAIAYSDAKYTDAVRIVRPPISVIKPSVLDAPKNVTISQHHRTEQGQSITTLSINWAQVKGAVAYIVEWRKDDNAWQVSKIASQSLDIDGVYSGNYQARIKAVDAFDNESDYGVSTLTQITGKIGKPPRLASFTANGILFGMELAWIFNAGSNDTNYTEIQVSPDGRSNIATLGQFAYPTNSHTITGLQGNLTQHYRARIVDKLGNVSDWTAWASGTTSAEADKVLDILSGQISQSHLDQSLRTPIAKIPTLETNISKINVDLPKLNQSIADERTRINSINQQLPTLNQNIANAQSTLNTAVANIDAEKKRITSAIVDINTLKQSNDAKTQELLNLSQTVGGHTSSIRDLGVTTGNLSQRYQQLKTTSDQHNTEITTIKQTTQNQAIEHNRLSARFDALPASSNLLLDSNKTVQNSNYLLASYIITTQIQSGQKVVITIYGTIADDRQLIAFNSSGSGASRLGELTKVSDNIYQLSANWVVGNSNNRLLIYQFPPDSTSVSTIDRAILSLSDPLAEQVSASLDEFKSVQADKDSATATKISQIETAYKQADNTLTAQIASETTARTNADSALSTRIDNLSSDYNSNKASVTSQLKTLSDKDVSTSSQIDSLTANYASVNSKADKAQSTADTANTNAQTAKRVADDALGKANSANAAIIAEQKTRADADGALSNRITALDAAYKQADSAANARITNVEKVASDATQAIAQTHQQLNAKFDSVNPVVLDNASATRSSSYLVAQYALDKAPKHGEQVIITIYGTLGAGRTHFGFYNSSGGVLIGNTTQIADDIHQYTGTWIVTTNSRTAANTHLWVYQFASSATSTSVINRIVIERSSSALALQSSKASLDEFKSAQADKDSATAEKMSQIEAAYKSADDALSARITTAQSTASGAQQAVAQTATELNARFDNVRPLDNSTLINNSNYQLAYYSLANPPAHGESVVITIYGALGADRVRFGAYNSGGSVKIGDLAQVADGVYQYAGAWVVNAANRTAANTALAIYQIASSGTSASRIERIIVERTSAGVGLSAQASALNNYYTKAQADSATAQSLQTLQTTVGQHTSSIQQHAQSLNGLSAQWTLKVQTGGVVSGIGLASENGVSDFAIRADKFYVASPQGDKTPMFSTVTTTTTINDVTVPPGNYLSDAFIRNGSISIAKINTASIESLSALSANIGTLTTKDNRGSFTYTGSKIELRDPQGRLLMEMGLL